MFPYARACLPLLLVFCFVVLVFFYEFPGVFADIVFVCLLFFSWECVVSCVVVIVFPVLPYICLLYYYVIIYRVNTSG